MSIIINSSVIKDFSCRCLLRFAAQAFCLVEKQFV